MEAGKGSGLGEADWAEQGSSTAKSTEQTWKLERGQDSGKQRGQESKAKGSEEPKRINRKLPVSFFLHQIN